MAQILGLDEATVGRGWRDLLAGDVQPSRIRRAASGRKKTPDLLNQLGRLLQEDTARDPTGKRRVWTGKAALQE